MRGSLSFRDLEGNGLILFGFAISVIFWLLEASNHVLFFADSDLYEAIFAPTWHELWMRLTVVMAFMGFAFIASHIVKARRRAEDASIRALAEVDQVFETAADGMRIVDKDFRVLRANDTFAELVGLPKSEIIGRKCHDVFWGDRCDAPGCPLTRVLGGDEFVEYDADKVCSDGKSIPCIVSATPYRRPDGRIVGIVEDFKDISERKQAERNLRESEDRLRELTAHLQSIREDERSRIAREIHDELGQVLTALSLDVRWLHKRLPEERGDLLRKTHRMGELITTTVGSVSRICSELRPAILDDVGLSAAIEWQASEFSSRTGIVCDIETEPPHIKLSEELSVAIFRIFQETLTNIVRHAQATKVHVVLRLTRHAFSMRVCDDGVGMEFSEAHKMNSFGLLGVMERVRGFGGEMAVYKGDLGGACLNIIIPSPDPPAKEDKIMARAKEAVQVP
ncbi:MAG: PAS domain S-box protein [Rhodothermales bacterium]|nr:PAS domain S-box protein [Rhodothermales bacterium]